MIGQKGIPATYGGVERHVEELSARLVELGHDVTVYSRPHYGRREVTEHRGVRVVMLPSIATKHLDAITHTAVCTAHAMRHGFDIVHYHAVGPALLSWLPRVREIPTVVTIHGQDHLRPKWGWAARVALKAGQWTAVHGPAATICVSESLALDLQRTYGRRVDFVPNGVKLCTDTDDSILDELGIEPNRYILFAGRLVPEKGCHYLIDAWCQAGRPMPLVMAGDSSFSRDYVGRLRNMCADRRLLFPGYVYGPRLASLFRNAKLFVLPSDVEGLPIVLLEALGYGTPVLASDIPPNREVLGAMGDMFEAGNVSELRDALGSSLAESASDCMEMNHLAERVALAYSWTSVARHADETYRRALRSPVGSMP